MAIHSIFASKSNKPLSSAARATVLQNLISLASALTSRQLELFSDRLGEALLALSEQSVRPAEAAASFNAFNHLRLNAGRFQHAVAACLDGELAREIQLLEKGMRSDDEQGGADLSLVTFEEMENKVLIGNIGQSLEADIAESLGALNLRLAWLLGREEMAGADNPFRPQIFLQALYQGWCRIDPAVESHPIVLRLLGPELFLPLDSILRELNESLIENSILPDLTEAYRRKKAQTKVGLPPPKVAKSDEGRYNKVRDWLLSRGKSKDKAEAHDAGEDLNVPDLFAPATEGGSWHANTISVKVGPRLFGYLTSLQQQIDKLEASGGMIDVPQSAATLRQVKEHVPTGTLTQIDENTIELLAKIFDYVFLDQAIPDDMKRLLAQLQIPMLKAALIDKKFFVKDDHPARIFIDKLANSSLAWDAQQGRDDPLYKMIEQIVGRVQKEFDQQMGLFSDAAANLDAFLEEEEKTSHAILAEPIAEALRQEKMHFAQQAAENDVALRIETGEVASFVETFLETQWVRVLALAHSVAEQKPEVLAKALQVMDDLIWSIKPKHSPEQRKELISKLPSILAMLNAWLNAMKWNEPERVAFISNLAERHAAIVRIQPELSPRQQVEFAVSVAEKASEHKLTKRMRLEREKTRDQFARIVDGIEPGDWMTFVRSNGAATKFRLAWISPKRTRFIFTNRQGQNSFSFTADELAQSLRDRKASLVPVDSVIGRALSAAIEDVE